MTEERKNQLYDEMFGWICEHIHNDEDLFLTLHEHFGMTQEELHEHDIDRLDAFFPTDNAQTLLKQKVDVNFAEYKEKWLQMQPAELISKAEEIHTVSRMAIELPKTVSDEEAEYLLRFKNPLKVFSDAWLGENGDDVTIFEDEDFDHVLWRLLDTRDAETEYEMEPEYDGQSDTLGMSM